MPLPPFPSLQGLSLRGTKARTLGRTRLATATAFACLASAAGCAGPGADATAAAAQNLSPTATAYVAVPEDGRFGTRVYTGSGRDVAERIANALSSRLGRIEVAAEEQSPRAALAEARAGGFTYLIRPSILRWEDHDGAWLAGPDRARILVDVIHAASGEAADVAVIDASSAGPASQAGTEGTPAEALEAPLRAYAARLLPIQAAAAAR